MWVSWVPSEDTADVQSWRMWKLGQPISPLEVIASTLCMLALLPLHSVFLPSPTLLPLHSRGFRDTPSCWLPLTAVCPDCR